MISVSEENSVLAIRDIPAGSWIGAILFGLLLIGGLIAWVPDMLIGKGVVNPSILILLFTAGCVYCLSIPITETRFDKNLRKIFISKRSLFRGTYVEYGFEDADGGALLRVKDGRNGPVYWVELLLRNQAPIKLCVPDGTKENAVIAAVPTINSFLGIELSPDDFEPTQVED